MNFKKYLYPKNYFDFVLRNFMPKNFIVNKLVRSVSFDSLLDLSGAKVSYYDLEDKKYRKWVNTFFPDWKNDLYHKKLIEFFTSYSLLAPRPNDVFLDAAGGIYTYLKKLNSKKKYLQDLNIPAELKYFLGEDVEYLEGDIASINLPDESVDKITCHHSFEHFQNDADILFIKEIQRILKVGGKCCIIPIFISDRHYEIIDSFWLRKRFNNKAKKIVDPTATLPGGKKSGNFARVYDLLSFQNRILNNVDINRFNISILQIRLNNQFLPNRKLICHRNMAIVNYPYRALLVERK